MIGAVMSERSSLEKTIATLFGLNQKLAQVRTHIHCYL